MGRPPGRIDILMSLTGMDFDLAWPRRVEALIEDIRVPFISKEDLVASKLASGRPQDLNDVHTLQLPVRLPAEFQQPQPSDDLAQTHSSETDLST